jgi:hypothetical protein
MAAIVQRNRKLSKDARLKEVMTPNDTQMDVLMRRYAKHAAERSVSTEHLDADELNAFAEGALPPATRSRYVSHLADCGDCRRLASQLAITAGAVAEVQVPASEAVADKSWWQKLSVFLKPPALRYAAFAVVLLAVGGIAFLVWRRPNPTNSALVARNEPATSPASAVKPPTLSDSANKQVNEPSTAETRAVPQPTAPSTLDQKGYDLSPASPAQPAKPEKEIAKTEEKSAVSAARTMEPRAESSPSFAPAPPAETTRVDTQAREQQTVAGVFQGGPRRNESYDKLKAADRARSGELAKDRDEDRSRVTTNQPTVSENKQDDSRARAGRESRTMSVPSPARSEMRVETRKVSKEKDSPKTEEEPQTRSVGGRKFQRQANAWVDTKFKSSMSVRNIARGSEEFAALDSGLRSIAQQLTGEVVVVWKGKAYRIR